MGKRTENLQSELADVRHALHQARERVNLLRAQVAQGGSHSSHRDALKTARSEVSILEVEEKDLAEDLQEL